jgi:hypothetical protein
MRERRGVVAETEREAERMRGMATTLFGRKKQEKREGGSIGK